MVLGNKRGIFFTIVTIVIISLFLFSVAFYAGTEQQKEIEKRITTMNSFLFSIEEDLPRQLYILGFRSIFLFEKHIIESGTYLENINYSISEAFFNGTIEKVPQDLLKDVTITGIQDSINKKSAKINVEINLSVWDITLEQADSWNIKVKINSTLVVRDKANLASWTRNSTFETLIPIIGFEDPVYVINTNGKVTNTILETNITIFKQNSDVSNLTLQAFNSWYKESTRGPSFVDRLQGRLGPDPNGIESMVFEPEITAQGLSAKNKPVIDFIYFNNTLQESSSGVSGMPAWFKLDSDSFNIYGLN